MRFRVPLIILRHCTTLFEHIPNITATSHFICVHCRGSSKWGSDFRDGPSHFSPIHHWPLIEFSTMLTCHGSDLLQRTPQMIDLLGIWGIWRPDQHLELFVTFLWLFPCRFCGVWGRILVSGEEHCIGYSVHNVVWMGDVVPRPKLSLQSTKLWGNGQCYSHDLGVCRCITAATSIWFSESVHPSGWTGHNCITVRGITWSTLCSKGVTTQGN